MNTIRNRCLVAVALFALVAFALPADAVAGGMSLGYVKTGASGQDYLWAPGGC